MPHRLFLYIIICLIVYPSCKNAVTEQASIDEVLNTFGGAFGYTIDVSTGTSGRSTIYTLQLKQSETAEQLKESPALLSSGVALSFYSKLKDQENCTVIRPEITFPSGGVLRDSFDCQQLREVNANKRFFIRVTDMLKTRNYDSLATLVLPDTISATGTQNLIEQLQYVDQDAGRVQSATLLGFFEVENNEGKYIRYTGVTMREKTTVPISVLVERNKRKIVYMGFKM